MVSRPEPQKIGGTERRPRPGPGPARTEVLQTFVGGRRCAGARVPPRVPGADGRMRGRARSSPPDRKREQRNLGRAGGVAPGPPAVARPLPGPRAPGSAPRALRGRGMRKYGAASLRAAARRRASRSEKSTPRRGCSGRRTESRWARSEEQRVQGRQRRAHRGGVHRRKKGMGGFEIEKPTRGADFRQEKVEPCVCVCVCVCGVRLGFSTRARPSLFEIELFCSTEAEKFG